MFSDTEWSTFQVVHSVVGSKPHQQIQDKAGKAFQEQTLYFIVPIL
jgi:hypothetical protein